MQSINTDDIEVGEGSNQPINFNTYINFEAGAISIETINIGLPHEVFEGQKKKNNVATPNRNLSDMERAMHIVEEMAMEGMFRIKKRYFAVYKIIEEKFMHGMTTKTFCDIMERVTNLPQDKLPQNDQIRRVSCKKDFKYPNWKFSAPDDTKLAHIFTSYAQELLKRMEMEENLSEYQDTSK